MPFSISPISSASGTPAVTETRQPTGHPPAHDAANSPRHPHAHAGTLPSEEAADDTPDRTPPDAIIGTIVDVLA
jgi:hypothetical protein